MDQRLWDRLEEIKGSLRWTVGFDDVDELLRLAGFARVDDATGFVLYTHPELAGRILTIKPVSPLAAGAVARVVEAIEEVGEDDE
jgi:hypothetical protein